MYLFYYWLEIFTYNYLFCTMPPSHGALLTASVADAMTQYNVNHTNDAAWTHLDILHDKCRKKALC